MTSDRYEYNKKYREKNKEKILEKQREWREIHKEEIKLKKKEYYNNNKQNRKIRIHSDEKILKEHKEKINKNSKKYRENVKDKFLEMYGHKCNCCGETCKEFLTLDHINNDGNKDRAENNNGGSHRIRLKAIKEYRPDLYQVLCFNCNLGRSSNHGICPHRKTLNMNKDIE